MVRRTRTSAACGTRSSRRSPRDSLNKDDVCLQDGGDLYVRGYSEGAQQRWLERTLQADSADPDTDSIVVCMHLVSMSSATSDPNAPGGKTRIHVRVWDTAP